MHKENKENRAYHYSELPRKNGYEIAFVGRSNVGKSSLVNNLTGRSQAKVSSKPGHTLWLGIHKIGNVTLMDLPGYGYAATGRGRQQIAGQLVWDYLDSGRVDMVFVLIDMRRGIMDIDQQIIEELGKRAIPIRFVGTKSDKRGTSPDEMNFCCSNHTREGVEELKKYICNLEDESTV